MYKYAWVLFWHKNNTTYLKEAETTKIPDCYSLFLSFFLFLLVGLQCLRDGLLMAENSLYREYFGLAIKWKKNEKHKNGHAQGITRLTHTQSAENSDFSST